MIRTLQCWWWAWKRGVIWRGHGWIDPRTRFSSKRVESPKCLRSVPPPLTENASSVRDASQINTWQQGQGAMHLFPPPVDPSAAGTGPAHAVSPPGQASSPTAGSYGSQNPANQLARVQQVRARGLALGTEEVDRCRGMAGTETDDYEPERMVLNRTGIHPVEPP